MGPTPRGGRELEDPLLGDNEEIVVKNRHQSSNDPPATQQDHQDSRQRRQIHRSTARLEGIASRTFTHFSPPVQPSHALALPSPTLDEAVDRHPVSFCDPELRNSRHNSSASVLECLLVRLQTVSSGLKKRAAHKPVMCARLGLLAHDGRAHGVRMDAVIAIQPPRPTPIASWPWHYSTHR